MCHSINCELKEITEDNPIVTNPNQRQRFIIGDVKLFKEQISCIIETVNKLEDNHGLEKLEIDVKTIWPQEYFKESSSILEKCHQIESFCKDYDLSIIKIKLKKPYLVPRNMGVTNGNSKGTAEIKQDPIPRTPSNPSTPQNKENQTPDPKSDLEMCASYQ